MRKRTCHWFKAKRHGWGRGQKVAVHGWCYGLNDGLVKDLGVTMQGAHEVVNVFRNAIKRFPRGGAISAS